MQERIRFAVNEMLSRLIDMGVLKLSQVNAVMLNFTIAALQEGMREQKLGFEDIQNKPKV